MHTAAPKALFTLSAFPALGAVGTDSGGPEGDTVGIRVVGTWPVSEGPVSAVVLSGEESEEDDGANDEVDRDVVCETDQQKHEKQCGGLLTHSGRTRV